MLALAIEGQAETNALFWEYGVGLTNTVLDLVYVLTEMYTLDIARNVSDESTSEI